MQDTEVDEEDVVQDEDHTRFQYTQLSKTKDQRVQQLWTLKNILL